MCDVLAFVAKLQGTWAQGGTDVMNTPVDQPFG
jgi:hypothetical protein